MDFRSLLVFSLLLRVFLILYGEWHDAHMEVPYTDVDYIVFSDAASLMASGESPYKRTTYRYSPLLAFLLIPNSIFLPSWGKFLFSASDLLVGLFIRNILEQRKVPEKICTYSVMVWLFNPFTFTIGTRGNCEPIVCAMILWIILSLMRGNVLQAAFWYGLVVHFRVYPIIYALPIILVLDSQIFRSGQRPPLEDWNTGQDKTPTSNTQKKTFHLNLMTAIKSLFSRERIMFALISGGVFLACNVISFYFYGHEFLHEALLYHLTRTDPRHNFSIYFYHIYLHYEREFSAVEKLISFLPQFTVQFALVFCFSQDLVFCIFLQTVAFVAFNKVITAQYFVWFYCLLPLILPWSRMKLKWEGLLCIVLWIGAQTHWLLWGYMLEFKGLNVFLQLWVASLMFLAANTFVLIKIIQRHRFSPLFKRMRQIFAEEEVDEIIKIRPTAYHTPPSFTWIHSNDGNFSVKSAYWIWTGRCRRIEDGESSSCSPNVNALLASVWNLKTFPKVSHLLWKCLNKIIPVMEILKTKKMTQDSRCPRCGADKETVDHLFFHCPYARLVWAISPLVGLYLPAPVDSMFSNMAMGLGFVKDIPKEVMESLDIWPWIMWRLWKVRNEFCFSGTDIDPRTSLELAIRDKEEWDSNQIAPMPERHPQQNGSRIKWKAPQDGYLKCNVDASWHKDQGLSGVGWVLRDNNGVVQWYGAKCYPKPISPLHAEASGLLWAMNCLNNMGKKEVIFEMDSEILYNSLHQSQSQPGIQDMIAEMRQSWSSLRPTFAVVKREANGVADEVAAYISKFPLYEAVLDCYVPVWLETLVLKDRL